MDDDKMNNSLSQCPSQQSKSYFSDDDESQEDLLKYLLNVTCEIDNKIPSINDFNDISNEDYIKKIIISFEPTFEKDFSPISLEENNTKALDKKYSNFSKIISALDKYFTIMKNEQGCGFKESFKIKEMININNVINKNRKDLQEFTKVILVFLSTCENKDKYIDKLSEKKEKYLDGYLETIQNYIELNDEPPVEQPDNKARRFTTRSSVLFAFKDPSMLYASIDKLRKKIEDLENEKEVLSKSLKTAEENNLSMKNKLADALENYNMIKRKEEDLNTEIAYLRHKMNSNSFIVSEAISSNNEREIVLQNQVNEKENEIRELKSDYETKLRDYVLKLTDMEKELTDLKKNENKVNGIIEENSKIKKKYEQLNKESTLQIEQLTALVDTLKDNIHSLEKDKKEFQNKISALKAEIKEEQHKNSLLDTKLKEAEKNNKNLASQNQITTQTNDMTSDYVKQIEKLLSEVKDKNIEICDLHQENTLLKTKTEKKNYMIIQKREEVFYFAIRNDNQKQIKKFKEELKKKENDIIFLKKCYKDLKSKSEEEYNTVSSSLYELALHLTKMKNEVNKPIKNN